MAKLELSPSWMLRVDSAELRLIRAALGGRLKHEDLEKAKLLDKVLAEQTVTQTRDRLNEVDKLDQNISRST